MCPKNYMSIPLGSLDPGSKDPDLDPFFRKWSDLRSLFQGGSKTGSRSFFGAFWKRSDPFSTFYYALTKMPTCTGIKTHYRCLSDILYKKSCQPNSNI